MPSRFMSALCVTAALTAAALAQAGQKSCPLPQKPKPAQKQAAVQAATPGKGCEITVRVTGFLPEPEPKAIDVADRNPFVLPH